MELFDTGISWIGNVPSDWKILPLKSVSKVILGKMLQDKQKSQEETLERYICAKDVHLDGINWYEPKEMYFSPMEKNLLLVKKGDLLIVEGGAGAGGAFVAENPTKYNYYVQNSINIVRVNKKFAVPQYVYYWIFKLVTNKYVEVACNVATIPHFTKEKVSSVQIPLPSIDIQRRIVNYLDTKVAEIDNQISLLSKKRDAYMRLKKSIIHRAVSQGLNPDVEMKDSGVDWIGMIPKHWEIKRFKEVFRAYTTGITPESKNSAYFEVAGGYTWVTIADMSGVKYVRESNLNLSNIAVTLFNPALSVKGSLLFSFKLSVGKISIAAKDLYTNEAIVTIPPKDSYCISYIYYMLPNILIHNSVENIYGAKMLNQKIIVNMLMAIPSVNEQHTIADYLDEKTAKIDAVVCVIEKQIEKYKQLKRALINEVVTGQRAV